MYCHNCGKQVSDNSKFCRYCGAALSEENATEEKPKFGDDLFGFENKAESGAQNGGAQQQGNAQQGNYQYGPGSYYTPQGGGQPGNYGYQYGRYTAPDDAKSVGFGVLGFFFPVVGFILWLIWHDDHPLRAKSCLKGVLAGVVFYVLIVIIAVIVTCVAAQDALEYYYYYY